MRIVVLGAGGGTGRLVVRQALDAGYEVTALSRNPGVLPQEHERLRVVNADLFDAAQLEPVLDGAQAVLSALGWNSAKDATPVCSTAARSILQAMRGARMRRLVVLSAAPVLRSGAGEPFLHRVTLRPFIRMVYREVYADLEEMENILSGSEVDWTIIRPGYLTDAPAAGRYRLAREANVPGSTRRADLAAAMIDVMGDPGTHRAALGIATG